MALTPDDGTGLAAADCYIDLAFFKTFCKARGYDVADYDTPDIEAKIREGFDWINTQARYKGQRLNADQAGEFPRVGCNDWSGFEATGIPLRVKHANCEVAFKSLKTGKPIFQDLERGGMIVSKTVGPISTTYAEGAPAGTVWTSATNFLKPYTRITSDNDTIRPGYAAPVAPQFDIGMDDAPDFGNTDAEG